MILIEKIKINPYHATKAEYLKHQPENHSTFFNLDRFPGSLGNRYPQRTAIEHQRRRQKIAAIFLFRACILLGVFYMDVKPLFICGIDMHPGNDAGRGLALFLFNAKGVNSIIRL